MCVLVLATGDKTWDLLGFKKKVCEKKKTLTVISFTNDEF
jgi:hypothetical protein